MRRKLRLIKTLGCIIIIMSLGFAIYHSIYVAPYEYTIAEYKIYDNKLSDNFNNFTIGFISDINIDKSEDINKLKEVVTTCNQEEFDFIVFGGDLYDTAIFDQEVVVEALSNLTSRYGKFAVLGEKDILYETKSLLSSSGFEVLQNEYRSIYKGEEFIHFFGLEATDDIEGLLSGCDEELFSFVAVHQPDYYNSLKKHTIDLQLSGHSNGGYINIPFLGPIKKKPQATNYTTGIYESSLVVSNGLTNEKDIPYRFNTPCQIVKITLTNKK